MNAATLDEAIELQNATDYGLTAGIHSLDAEEVARWIDSVDAGNIYVNRGITGAIVRRQPFGGWKRSTVGASTKAGGPNYVFSMGSWEPIESDPGEDLTLEGVSHPVARIIEQSQVGLDFLEFDRVRLAATRDEKAWQSEFGVSRDVSGLGVERNVFRYRPLPVTLRLSDGAPLGDLVRLLAAGTRAGSVLYVSTAVPLPQPLVDLFGAPDSPTLMHSVMVESDARWQARVAAGELRTSRIRLIGGDPSALSAVLRGNPDIAIFGGPVTTAGRIELLPFLHEQAVSITAHRFGNPDRDLAELPV
jgi:RHH-type proline utilization regulon transcriptional repressor/proline dehydrogenase/delta 1-pyrroline-5-carboxylate dehydrogenase